MKKQVEDIYKKVTQVEHVLLRPDTYVGSVELSKAEMRIWDKSTQNIILKEIEISQGLYKIFDEILVNAADNYQRDHSMRELNVFVREQEIIVENDGRGIPVQVHKEVGVYVPELIFGHLLTSSNYDDSIKKVTGGRNGFGAKLANIFSKRFTLETSDKKKSFKMTWRDNMHTHDEAEIGESGGKQLTRVTFEPDFKRFQMKRLSEDMVSLLSKRVVDMAAILGPHVKVNLNGKRVQVSNFQEYVGLYGIEQRVYGTHESDGRVWQVAVTASDGQFQQVSFVNSINTVRGGQHVNHVCDQIVEGLIIHIKKKYKEFKAIKPFQVKQHLMVFINCLIDNPAFDSQTKETLTTKIAQFGSTFVLKDKFLDEIVKKTAIVENVVVTYKNKLDNKLAKQLTGKKQSRLLGIEKLEDANWAGTKTADQCTLIITEGDSAKSLAMAGLEVVGRDRWGVFPLRGKLLNVRDATTKQMMENKEIESLVKILGLQFNKKYENTGSLRYGSLMIMTDQDVDGHHIKGLVLNLFDRFWPSLLQTHGFLKQFATPIVKVSLVNDSHSFFSLGEYRKFMDRVTDRSGYKVKYYKGLGTSTDLEGQQYFSNLPKHIKLFKYVDSSDSEYIDLAFSKTKSDARKDWLAGYSWSNIVDTLDYSIPTIRYKNFITDCLALYSVSDNIRSIPSLVDGLKPTQRKVLYTILQNPHKTEHKVSSLGGLVSALTNYHHGDQSLSQTIISMAQNFTGSNNINLLLPLGQFGTRSMGGKDAAQARYISTRVSTITTKLFCEQDLHTLKYWEEEGLTVEPTFFVPVLPLVLINGAEGIGTGWMTHIPMYNPREVAQQIRNRLTGSSQSFQELSPWYRGYVGPIEFQSGGNQFTLRGRFQRYGDRLFITEIPVRRTPKDIQALLQLKMQGDEPDIIDMKEHHGGNKVCFEVLFREGVLEKMSDEEIEKYLKLSNTVNINNIVLFDSEGKLRRYSGVAQVLDEFYEIRLKHYHLRLKYLISKVKHDLDVAENKAKFLQSLLNRQLDIFGLSKEEVIKLLRTRRFTETPNMEKIQSTRMTTPEDHGDSDTKAYEYLLGMSFWSISKEKVEEHLQKYKSLKEYYETLQKTKVEDLWIKDIDEVLVELSRVEVMDQEEYIKRLHKNAEEILRGGAKIMKENINKKIQTYNLDNDSYDDDQDGLDDKQGNNGKKLLLKVLNDFSNLGISSIRVLPIEVQINLKKQKNNPMEQEDQLDQQSVPDQQTTNKGTKVKIHQNNSEDQSLDEVVHQKQNKKDKKNIKDEIDIQVEFSSKSKPKNTKLKKNIENDENDMMSSNRNKHTRLKKNNEDDVVQSNKNSTPKKKKNVQISESGSGSDDSISDSSSVHEQKLKQINKNGRQSRLKRIICESSGSVDLSSDQSDSFEPPQKIKQNVQEKPSKKQQQTEKNSNKKRLHKNDKDGQICSSDDSVSFKQPQKKKQNIKEKKVQEKPSKKNQSTEKNQSKKRLKKNDEEIDDISSASIECFNQQKTNYQVPKNKKKQQNVDDDHVLNGKNVVKKVKTEKIKVPIISEEEKLMGKYGLGRYMKYLKIDEDSNINPHTDNPIEIKELSLGDRLMLRQKEGNIQTYQFSYDAAKTKTNNQQSEQNINNNIVDDDFVNFQF